MLVYKFRKSNHKVYRSEDNQLSEDVHSIDTADDKCGYEYKKQRQEVSECRLADELLSFGLVAAMRHIILDAKHHPITYNGHGNCDQDGPENAVCTFKGPAAFLYEFKV